MPRDNGNNRQMRERIAQLAARLMAVDGIDDYALAKRKAARQAGAPDTRNLPNNDEVEHALRAYQQLYQADEQRDRLRHLRQQAREMMELLASFDPYLSGAVLSGSAGKYSDIDLLLFTDSMKDVEMFLINRQIAYRSGERRMHIGDETRGVPNFSVSTEDADFDITVFTPRDLRAQIRSTPEGRPLERVRRDWLDAALAANNAAGT
jgi:predicted nucleotidyltransferase